jgi:hypothetical protein
MVVEYFKAVPGETEGNHEETETGQPVAGPSIEHGTSQI